MANAMFWFFVPGFFHGSQYLAVCLSYYLKERGMPNGMNSWEISKVALGGSGPQVSRSGRIVRRFLLCGHSSLLHADRL